MSAAEAKSPQTAREWAIFYASLGWSVVPVRTGEKMPSVPWAKFQTLPADLGTINGWFDADPTIGLGLVQGRNAGTIVLDFDGELGHATLRELERRGLPASVRALTPGGGVHVFLRHPGRPIATRKGVLPGMDVRGDGGFVVCAPSQHANGGRYHWDVDCHPEDAPVADCPAWILPALEAPVEGPTHVGEVTRGAGPLGLSGAVQDGREAYMRDTVLAVCRAERDRLGRLPTEGELFEAAWPQYSRNVDFSRPGRGPDEFRSKVRYTLARASKGAIRGFEEPPAAGGGEAAADTSSPDFMSGQNYRAETVSGAPASLPLAATPFDPAALATLEPRQWVYGHFLLKRFLSVLGAPGGTGKTAYAIGVALSVALDRPLLGEPVHEAGPVWLYNLEDPRDEMLRRVWGAARAHKIDPAELVGRLYLDSGRERPLVVAERTSDGGTVALPIVEELIAELKRRQIVLLNVDPFVKSHRLEENRNEQVDFAASLWNRVADEAGCAILLTHHFRKGGVSGDVDAFRGAVALTDASRAAVSLSTMSEKEAERFAVLPDQRRFHVRADNAKLNLAPPPDKALWLKLHSVDLPNGDKVQAVMPWEPPSPWDGMPPAMVLAILERLREGPGNGLRHSPDFRSRVWAGHVVVEIAGKTPEQAKAILRTWEEHGVLERDKYRDPERREDVPCYNVSALKFAEMRQSFSGGISPDAD